MTSRHSACTVWSRSKIWLRYNYPKKQEDIPCWEDMIGISLRDRGRLKMLTEIEKFIGVGVECCGYESEVHTNVDYL